MYIIVCMKQLIMAEKKAVRERERGEQRNGERERERDEGGRRKCREKIISVYTL